MEHQRRPLRGHLTVLIVFFLFVLTTAAGIYLKGLENDRLPVLAQVGSFHFTERSGQPFGLPDLEDRVNLVDFMFTNCEGPCPRMTARMAGLYQEFAAENRVQFISITVDPERDSLQVLEAYARKFGVEDRRWSFLRAPLSDVTTLAEKSFMLGSELPSLHSTKFILVDGDGRIRGYFNSEDSSAVVQLRRSIRKLLKDIK